MFVPRINNIKTQPPTLSYSNQKANFYCSTLSNSEQFVNSPSFLGKSKVYSDQVQALKSDMAFFSQDVAYRKNLMLNAGKNPDEYYKLRSIIGLGEIDDIMAEFNDDENFYSTGVNDENIKNCIIRANLHMHTNASDGFLTTQELLDKAAAYADKVAQTSRKEPFTVAITDHDTTESAKEAIEIISKDPIKYKNLRVILGCEVSTAINVLGRAQNTHILVYGIDPNEKTFSEFIDNTKQRKNKIASMMIQQANNTYRKTFDKKDELFSLKQVRDFYGPVKKSILGLYNYVGNYIDTKIMIDQVVLKTPILVEKLVENGLPTETNGLLDGIKNFYHQIDDNTTPHMPITAISKFLASKMDMEESEIQEIIENTPKSEDFEDFTRNIKQDLEPFALTSTPKYYYMPTLKDLFNVARNQDSTMVGIAHPLGSLRYAKEPKEKYEALIDLYNEFKKVGKEKAGFSEVYYQSYSGTTKAFKEEDATKELLNELSEELNLFKTGSSDSHRKNIFKRFD